MSADQNPDWRYANMTRTEIEDHIKLSSSILTSHKHTIPQSSGRQIKFIVTKKDIEHLVSDALYRAHGVFFFLISTSYPPIFIKQNILKQKKTTKARKLMCFTIITNLFLTTGQSI